MITQLFLAATHNPNDKYFVRNAVYCKDGFHVSIQASAHHYCTPRKHTRIYETVELGFPSEAESILRKYAEDRRNLTQTVYAQVPVSVVDRLIKKHGGIDLEKTFKD